MEGLLTPPDTLNMLSEKGYRYWRSCNCHGTYWEKFKKKGGYVIKIAPNIDLFNIPALRIGGTIAELSNHIDSLI